MIELFFLVISVGVVFYFVSKNKIITPSKPFDPKEHYNLQKERVSTGGYKKKAILNRTEQTARKAIYKAIYDQEENKNVQLLAQVCLGEMLGHDNDQLFRDINSKRVDFVVTNNNFYPLFVLEIQGQGHYNNSATQRDIIKREAIESAGIGYEAVAVGGDNDRIYQAVYDKAKLALINYG